MSQEITFKCTTSGEEVKLKTQHVESYMVTRAFLNFMKGGGYNLNSILDAMTEIDYEHRGEKDE